MEFCQSKKVGTLTIEAGLCMMEHRGDNIRDILIFVTFSNSSNNYCVVQSSDLLQIL